MRSHCDDKKFQIEYLTYFLRNIGPKLIPFLKTIVLYFVLYPETGNSGVGTVTGDSGRVSYRPLFKCLPICSLMFFIAIHALNNFPRGSPSRIFALKLFLGLLWSCVGDFILATGNQNIFYCGVFCFLIAHFIYIYAFGLNWIWSPVAAMIALLFYSAIVLPLIFCSASIADPVYVVSILLYAAALVAMPCSVIAQLLSRVRHLAARAARRSRHSHVAPAGMFQRWLCSPSIDLVCAVRVCSAVGALLFVLSDVCLAWNRNVHPSSALRTLVMPTYYAAQFGIALAVADPLLLSSHSH